MESLANEVMHATEEEIKLSDGEQKTASAAAPSEAPKKIVEKKPGRAFRHKLAGKFLAESGEFVYLYFTWTTLELTSLVTVIYRGGSRGRHFSHRTFP